LTERVTPHDLDAERAILGAILVDGERLLEISEHVSAGDFYRVAHRLLFRAMQQLSEQRQPIDLVTVKSVLDPRALEEVGGPAYIASLTDGLPRGSHVAGYCQIVKDRSIRRRLQDAADRAIAQAGDVEVAAAAALEQAEQAIYAIAEREQRGDLKSASSVVSEAHAILEQIADTGRPVTGIPTGFFDLDRDTRGLQPGNLVLLAARPAMGKTAIALNIAHHAAIAAETTTAIFSLEMSRTELMIRLLTAAGRVDAHRVMTGKCHAGEMGRISTAMAEVGATPIWIDDTSSQTVMSIRGKARRMKAKRGLGLVVIDYLQLLSSERRYDSRVVEVGAMSRALKQLAKELEVPILCLAQLNRAPEARGDGRPKLSDLRESGSLEQDADLVLLLHRPAVYAKEGSGADESEAELIIAKHRNGPTGSVKLRWSKEMTRFDNLSHLRGRE
jgi:replicative DNA helicase